MIVALGLVLSLAVGQHAPQRAGSEPLAPELEARVQRLGKQLRCAVCQGLSIADSPAQMARAQLDTVRSLVTEGKSDQEIYDYFVARYGEWALLEPPRHGFNWIVWAGPGLLVLFGLVVIGRLFKTRPGGPPPPPSSGEGPPAETTNDPYLDAVRAELKR